MFLENRRTA